MRQTHHTQSWFGRGLLAALALTLILTPVAARAVVNVPPNLLIPPLPPNLITDVLNIGVGGANGTVTQTANFVFVDAINMGIAGTGFYNLSGGIIRNQAGAPPVPNEVIGVLNSGFFTQTGGDHAVNKLILGQNVGSFGSYNLSGAASVFTLTGNLTVGRFGSGSFTQADVTYAVPGSFILGEFGGSTGTYTLNSGALNPAFDARVGESGTGVFNHVNGNHTIGSTLVLGSDPGSTGTYTLTAGQVKAANIIVGDGGTGFFVQNGGNTPITGNLILGQTDNGKGTYTFNAGTLTFGAGSTMTVGNFGSGTFTQSAALDVPSLIVGNNPLSDGKYTMNANLNVTALTVIGGGGAGTFTQNAGTLVSNLRLGSSAGASGKYFLVSGAVTSTNESIGVAGTGLFAQSGGAHTVTSLILGEAPATGDGTYTLSGAASSLKATAELIGFDGTGRFNQSAGSNTVGDFALGHWAGSKGTYNLSGGTLTAVDESIGRFGTGEFNQSAGSNTVIGVYRLGQTATGVGSYNLSGGTLTAGNGVIGNGGKGEFNQSAGTHTLTGHLFLGLADSEGVYKQSAGSLTVGTDLVVGYIGAGVFKQVGGTNTVTRDLILARSAGSEGTYTMSSGNLFASQELIGNRSTGVFTQTGGNNFAGSVTLGVETGGVGTYNLHTGAGLSLGVAGGFGVMIINGTEPGQPTGIGVFNQLGGTLAEQFGSGPFEVHNYGTFNYSGGFFTGRLRNFSFNTINGVVNFNADFNAGNGLEHRSLIPLIINAGRTVTLNGAGAAFGQPNNLDNWATIMVNGNLGVLLFGSGPLVNNTTGLLVGAGTITGNLQNLGTIDPGNYLPGAYVGPLDPRPQNQQAGVLNFTGSFTQAPTGTLLVDVLSPATFDRMNGTGAATTATLAGTVAPTLRGGFIPTHNQVFANVVAAPGGVTGTFDTVANQQINLLKFWQPVYNPTQFNLRVAADFTNVACLNPNTLQVGAMLNTIAPGAPLNSDLNSVLDAIANLSSANQICAALTEISPAKAAVLPNLAFAGAKLQWQTLSQRLTSLRYGTAGGQLGRFGLQGNSVEGLMMAYTSGVGSATDVSGSVTGSRYLDTEGQWAVYTDFNMAIGSFNGNVGMAGSNYSIPGFTLGADYRLQDDLLIGVATGYRYTYADFDGSGGNVNGNTWPITAYAAWFPGQAYVFGSLGYALNLYDLERQINFVGLNRVASGSTTGNQFNLYAEAGYDFKAQPFTITPTVNLAYSYLNVGSFTESGANALNLKVDSQSVDSLQTGIGARFAVDLMINKVKMVPQAYALYVHEFGNGNRDLGASLAQTGGSGFSFRTSQPGRDFAVLGGSLTAGLSKNLSLNINYNAEVGRQRSSAHFINAGLRYLF